MIEAQISKPTLQQLFPEQHHFAWQLLQAECNLHTNPYTSSEDVLNLSQMYMVLIEKLNAIQDSRESYFSRKMEKMMAKPFVIRSFEQQKHGNFDKLEQKRKQFEQKLSDLTIKQSKAITQKMISHYEHKISRMQQKINSSLRTDEKKLQCRLKQRRKETKVSDIKSQQMTSSSRKRSKFFEEMFADKLRKSIKKKELSDTEDPQS